jgi:cytosine/adenosine deaminase-related metal-dependent hydrolase
MEDGAVCIEDGVILDVGPWSELRSRWAGWDHEDLGEAVLMPGLVNAHCHLDYTGMAGMLEAPGKDRFANWIKGMLALKAHWSYSEYAQSWVLGARQLEATGCTLVGDIEAVPELLPDSWNATNLRVVSFMEMTGVRSGHAPEGIVAEAEANIARLPNSEKHWASFSPHALYSTPPELLRMIGAKMRAGARVSMHLAESRAEFDMYCHAEGPLFDWLKGQRSMTDCGGRTPVAQAAGLGMLGPSLLAVHCNYLGAGDAALLASHGVSVAHCPYSHSYFDHARFPYEELRNAGVNIALGTDSLASVFTEKGMLPRLNMWAEMGEFARIYPDVPRAEIIEMATRNGARALGVKAGVLEPGFFADLIAVNYAGRAERFADAVCATIPSARVLKTN